MDNFLPRNKTIKRNRNPAPGTRGIRNPFLGFIVGILVVACGTSPAPSESPTVTPTATNTHSPSPTLTTTNTPSPTPTAEPAWYQTIAEAYGKMEYRYGLVNDPKARVYASLEDAIKLSGNFGYLPNAPGYVSVVGEETREGKTYYTVYYGWMLAEDVHLVTPSSFQGILLTREIPFRFGWVLSDITSTNIAGVSIRSFHRYDLVHEVQSSMENPGYFAIGPDEWLPEDSVAMTSAQVPGDAGENTCRFIYTDLSKQTLRVYEGCKLVFATLVSTGKQKAWTFPGRFGITFKVPYLQLTPPPGSLSVYYLEGVPNFMTYYGDLGFHGAYWHDEFGTPVSHGCINLSPADAKWLYEWAWIGERVIISAGE